MAEVFEVSKDCAASIEGVLAETGYQVKHPRLKKILVEIGSFSASYVVDSILFNMLPIPTKKVVIFKIVRWLGVTILGGMIHDAAQKDLNTTYDNFEMTTYKAIEQIQNVMKEDSNEGSTDTVTE